MGTAAFAVFRSYPDHRLGYLQPHVETVEAASAALRTPSLTVTADLAARLSVAEVTFGVQEAGAVPPEKAIGTVAAALPLLMATMTTPSVPLNADSRTSALELPATSTIV